jgi:hypothetical protein
LPIRSPFSGCPSPRIDLIGLSGVLINHVDSFTAFLLSGTRDAVATNIPPDQIIEAQRMAAASSTVCGSCAAPARATAT